MDDSSSRGHDQSCHEGYEPHAGDVLPSDGESPSFRDVNRSGPPLSYDDRHKRHDTTDFDRSGAQSMRGEYSTSGVDATLRHGMRSAHASQDQDRRTGDSDQADATRMLDPRGDDMLRSAARAPEDTRRFEARPHVSGRTISRAGREEKSGPDVFLEESSKVEPNGPRDGSAIPTCFREAGRGKGVSSRYEYYGPRHHVRGPRRTGHCIDFDDDSGSEGEYQYRGGRF